MDELDNGGDMKRKKKVYVESSVISQLTARDSRDVLTLAMQVATREWWATRSKFDLYISYIVRDEISHGDPRAAKLRMEAVAGIQMLDPTEASAKLAVQLLSNGAVPETEPDDAAHIAMAAAHGMDLLVTWNHTHIANQTELVKIRKTIEEHGFIPPLLINPIFILEGKHEN
jgi:hypothetical protein